MKRFNPEKELKRSKRKYTKKHLVFSLLGLIGLTILGISFAYYDVNYSSIVVNGNVKAPINITVMQGEEEVSKFPATGSEYEYSRVECVNGTTGTWDAINRKLNLNFAGNDDCTVYFIVMTPLQRCLNDYANKGITPTDDSYFTYTTTKNEVTITNVADNAPRDVVIPCEINDNPVITLADHSAAGFHSPPYFHSFVLPETLEEIGNEVFSANDLNSINIPSSLHTIGNYAFYQSGVTFNELNLENVTYIGGGAFMNIIIDSLVLGDGLTTIFQSTFINSGISKVEFGSIGLEYEGTYDSNLNAFSGNNLGHLIIPEGWTTVPAYLFDEAGVTSVSLPDSLQSIGDFAFENHRITSLEIPGTVNEIGNYAFGSGSTISNLVINDGVEILGNSALGSVSDPVVDIPSSVTHYKNAIGASSGVVINFHGKSGPSDFVAFNDEHLNYATVNFLG